MLKAPVRTQYRELEAEKEIKEEKAQSGIEPTTLLSQVMHSTAVLQPLHNFRKANVFFENGILRWLLVFRE